MDRQLRQEVPNIIDEAGKKNVQRCDFPIVYQLETNLLIQAGAGIAPMTTTTPTIGNLFVIGSGFRLFAEALSDDDDDEDVDNGAAAAD